MKTKANTEQQLQAAIGRWVRLVNVADVDMRPEQVCIHVHGKLDYTDDDGVYSVCTQDQQGHGTNSVSFQLHRVEGIFTQPSGIVEITLF